MDSTFGRSWPSLLLQIRTGSISVATTQTCRPWKSDVQDPVEHRNRLIHGRAFTQSFLVTYQAVACGILLIFTIWHWYDHFTLRRRRRRSSSRQYRQNANAASTSSSSSGTVSPREDGKPITNERTPLLTTHSIATTSQRQKLWRRVCSLAMYQPPAIPIINKTLPSNSTTLFILFLLGLNIFYATYNLTWTLLDVSIIFPDRCGLLFASNLPWLYLTAAKNQPIKFLTGYSYENLNIVHRRIGEVMCLLAVIHAVGMFSVWYCYLLPVGLSLWSFLTHPVVYLGLLAFVCYETLYFSSLASFRNWWYELFLGTHVLLQTGALAFLFFHYKQAQPYVAVALFIFLVDRLIFRMLLKSKTVRADLAVMEDGETVLLSADWPIMYRWWSTIIGSNTTQGWRTTEHVFLTIPSLAPKHIIQAHPFTIASAAPDQDHEHAWFNLIIRTHDGFTNDLLKYAKTHTSASIRLDGPYGSLHALSMLQSSDVSLIIAGGSGIAVAYPLLWALLHNRRDAEANVPRSSVGLIWVIQQASHVSWIGQERLDELKEMGLHLCIPAPTSKAGRPDTGRLVRDMTEEMMKDVEISDPSVAVVVSGPDGMNRTVRNTCARMAWEGMDIDVAVEKYGW